MKNSKGFTLIELLVTMVILGIIMVVAVPNVMGILNNSRANTYVEDAKKFLSLAEYKFRGTSSITRPSKGNKCIIMSLKYLDNSEFENAPNNGSYDKNNSYVVITNTGIGSGKNNYVYYVNLVENVDGSSVRGIPVSSYSTLYDSEPSDLVKTKQSDFPSISSISGSSYCSGGIMSGGLYNTAD